MRWLTLLLVLGIAGHPPGPAHFTACVKSAMPLEPPQLLDRHMPCGVIHEHTLNTAGVPVEGEVLHLIPGTLPVAVVIARHEPVGGAVVWPAAAPHHIHKHRDVVQIMARRIDRAPVPILPPALNVGRRIVEPVVIAVTRPCRDGLGGNMPVPV